MVLVLEFRVFEGDGQRVVHKMIHRAKTVDEAQNHARSVLKNVLIEGVRADLCEVKDPLGKILGVVPAPT